MGNCCSEQIHVFNPEIYQVLRELAFEITGRPFSKAALTIVNYYNQHNYQFHYRIVELNSPTKILEAIALVDNKMLTRDTIFIYLNIDKKIVKTTINRVDISH